MRRLLTALALVVGADAKASLYCPDSEASNYKAPADRPLRGERASPHCARRGLMNRTARGVPARPAPGQGHGRGGRHERGGYRAPSAPTGQWRARAVAR